jgi:hypothetical protein
MNLLNIKNEEKMKNKKLFLVVSLLMAISVVTTISGLILWHYKKDVNAISIIVGVYFGILSILFFVFQMIYNSKKESGSVNSGRKRYKSGYFIIPIWIFSIIYISIGLLYKWEYTMLYLGMCVCLISLIWILILRILSKQSLSGQEDCIVEPEKFWRIIWNMLPARFGHEKNPILNVLIIHSIEGENQAKQMQLKYEQAKDELWIDHHLCVINNKKQLENKLTTINYIGIHLIYTEDIKSRMPWVRELCYKWASNNKSKPIVYTNCTDEDQPLNYGTSNKDSDGILRLFQRTHTLSESWQEQADIQHKFFKWLFVSFITILIGFNLLLFFNHPKNEELISKEQIVLLGGGTVKEYIEQKIDSTFSTDNLLFIPMPSALGCKQLGDEGFIKRLQGKVIIMSSERQKNNSAFRLGDKSPIKHILEIHLCTDTFHIRSVGIKGWQDIDDGIDKKTLIRKIETDSKIKTIYHTNENSATYNFYKDIIDAAKKMKKNTDIYYAGKEKTSFTDKNNYIIFTRSFYDPIPPNSKIRAKKINVLDEDGNVEMGELFLYIPITNTEMPDNHPYEMPSQIQNFLNTIGIEKFPTKIEDNQYDKKIISDSLFVAKKKEKILKTEKRKE